MRVLKFIHIRYNSQNIDLFIIMPIRGSSKEIKPNMIDNILDYEFIFAYSLFKISASSPYTHYTELAFPHDMVIFFKINNNQRSC